MERESTQGGEELGFGHRAKVSRCDDRAPLRQRASMTEKRLTSRACCNRDRVRADRFPPSLTPSPPWFARTRRGWRRRSRHARPELWPRARAAGWLLSPLRRNRLHVQESRAEVGKDRCWER